MLRRAPQAVDIFQDLEVVRAGVGISEGWADDGDIIVWEEVVVDGVFQSP